ncbi:MAG TPA: hypothetical protein VNS56_20805 [Methylomirabilota bacterium]|nr:hypothetical protein [Methylomirabilota bacterium]
MDGETRAYLDQALGSLRQEFVGLRQVFVDLRQEVRDTAAETRRHFDVVAEFLRRDIQTVAEGVAANTERIDRVEVDLKSEMEQGFAATHAVVRAAFRDLRRGID